MSHKVKESTFALKLQIGPPRKKKMPKADLFLNLDQDLTGYFSFSATRYHNEKMSQNDKKSKKWHFINGFGYTGDPRIVRILRPQGIVLLQKLY